jgi:hypothetical protein
MENQIDFEFRHQALEQRLVDDRAGHLAIDLLGNGRVEPRDIESDDAAIATFGKAIDQAMADLAAGTSNENDRFTHQRKAVTIEAAIATTVATRQMAAPMK